MPKGQDAKKAVKKVAGKSLKEKRKDKKGKRVQPSSA
jgi:hypothetical protein